MMSQQPIAAPEMTPRRRVQRSYAITSQEEYRAQNDPCYEGMLTCLGWCFGTLGSIPLFCCFPNPFKEIAQGSVGMVTKFGRFVRSVDPGLYKINPFCEQLRIIDVRMRVQDIPRQVALTKDNVSVDVDSVLYWEIADPYIATFLVSDVQKALIERTQTTLRMVIGNRTLQDTIEHREAVATEIKEIIDSVAESWGVNVESILLKDIVLGPEILANISSAATQKRLGESKVISAQAEVNAAKLMREAADILNSPAAMQIRYLETLQQMASHAGTKIIFMPAGASSGLTTKDATVMEIMADKH